MDKSDDHETRIRRLEQQIAALEKRLDRTVNTAIDYNDQLVRGWRMNSDDIDDAFARIKNLEFTAFPNLASDILKVYEITGGQNEDKRLNPLNERKKPEPKG